MVAGVQKTLLKTLLSWVVLLSVVQAGEQDADRADGTTQTVKGPRIHVEQRTVDLGTIREGTVATATFVIENRGDKNLIITRVHASCGCTSVKLTDEEKIIKPGHTQKIIAKFDSKNRTGKQAKVVTVFVNDPREKKVILTFKANVERLIKVLPRPFINLRSVQRGVTLDPFDVYPTRKNEKLESFTVEIPRGILTHTREPVVNDEGAEGVRLVFTVPQDADLGVIRGTIKLRGTVGGEETAVNMKVTGKVVGVLTTHPVSLQSLAPTQRGRRFAPITVSSTNDQPFRILSADAGPHIDVEVEARKQNKEYYIKTRLKESAPDGPLGTYLVIRTDNNSIPLLRIPMFIDVKLRYIIEPAMVLLAAGDRETCRVRLQNTSAQKLEIKSVSTDNPLVAADVQVGPANRVEAGFVQVRLQGPPPSGQIDATVIVVTNIEGAEEIRIPVVVSAS